MISLFLSNQDTFYSQECGEVEYMSRIKLLICLKINTVLAKIMVNETKSSFLYKQFTQQLYKKLYLILLLRQCSFVLFIIIKCLSLLSQVVIILEYLILVAYTTIFPISLSLHLGILSGYAVYMKIPCTLCAKYSIAC